MDSATCPSGPVQLGVILPPDCGIGLINPPLVSRLSVASAIAIAIAIAGVSMTGSLKTIWPFWLTCADILMRVTFIPALPL